LYQACEIADDRPHESQLFQLLSMSFGDPPAH
jgi:hypothetical protein